ncbi:anthranilate synthase component I family protein, partial [bacterium]|nr:anthranilate synthase component I family protein [bacterium]
MNNSRYQQATLPYLPDSTAYFTAVRGLGYAVLLDSGRGASNTLGPQELQSSSKRDSNRFDIICAGPAAVIESQGSIACCFAPGRRQQAEPQTGRDPVDLTRDAINSHTSQLPRDQPWPFAEGAIALFGYGYGEQRHDIHRWQAANLSTDNATQLEANWPDYCAGIYQWAIIQDHKYHRAILLADPKLAPDRFKAILDRASKAAEANEKAYTPSCRSRFSLATDWRCSMSREQYGEAFQAVKDYILAGDCYQINLTLQHSAEYHGDPWLAYQQLRKSITTPFGVFLESPHGQLISFSPERFLRCKQNQVVTQPIKGTRPRGHDAADDARLMAELSGSDKDRAENLMIVDLLRNDIGQCCVPGSVSVPKLFQLETYSNVHHLVSTITGQLRDDCDALELLKQCMPGGSITGSPKLRAMEIIAELEPHRRSIY